MNEFFKFIHDLSALAGKVIAAIFVVLAFFDAFISSNHIAAQTELLFAIVFVLGSSKRISE